MSLALPPDHAAPRWDVLGLGCTAVDDLLYVANYPAPDTKVEVRKRERRCGGQAAIALVAAAPLCGRCAFARVLGDDDESRVVVASLREEGGGVGPLVHQ